MAQFGPFDGPSSRFSDTYGLGAETWDRGDGQPDARLLEEALHRILQIRDPAEIRLCEFAARGELRKNSDIDLLSVVADAPPDRPREIRKSP